MPEQQTVDIELTGTSFIDFLAPDPTQDETYLLPQYETYLLSTLLDILISNNIEIKNITNQATASYARSLLAIVEEPENMLPELVNSINKFQKKINDKVEKIYSKIATNLETKISSHIQSNREVDLDFLVKIKKEMDSELISQQKKFKEDMQKGLDDFAKLNKNSSTCLPQHIAYDVIFLATQSSFFFS